MAADMKIVDLHTAYHQSIAEKSCYFTTWYIDYTVTAVTIDLDNTSQEKKGSAPHLTFFIGFGQKCSITIHAWQIWQAQKTTMSLNTFNSHVERLNDFSFLK